MCWYGFLGSPPSVSHSSTKGREVETAVGGNGFRFIKGKTNLSSEYHSFSSAIGSASSVLLTASSSSSNPNSKILEKLNREEIDDLRSKNLCFYCHKPFFKGHRCSPIQKVQIQLIEFELESEEAIIEDTGQALCVQRCPGDGKGASR